MTFLGHHFSRRSPVTVIAIIQATFFAATVLVVVALTHPSSSPVHKHPKLLLRTALLSDSKSATKDRVQRLQRQHIYNPPSFYPSLLSSSSSSSSDEQDTTIMGNDGNDKQSPSSPSSNSSLLERVTTAIGSTTSIAVAGTFYVVLCYRRDALMVSFFGGAISNGILSKVLKKVLNVARPAELDTATIAKQNGGIVPSDNGMPSSHAMSLGFICTFTAIQIPALAIPLLAYTAISLRYRINTKLHSFDQILVGAILGSVNGALWHSLCYGTFTLWPQGWFGQINVMEWVSNNILSDDGLLPWYLLSIPALVGAAVVGSIERRLSHFFNKNK